MQRKLGLGLAILVVAGLALFAGLRLFPTGPAERDLFTYEVMLDLGRDVGQPLGSVFELRQDGRTIAGAGFGDGFSTFMRENNRVLSLFVSPEPGAASGPAELEDLGKPFEPAMARTMHIDNRILTIMKPWRDSELLAYDESAGAWQPEGQSDRQQYVGVVDNKHIEFFSNSIEYDGETIFRANCEKCRMTSIYHDGVLYSAIYQKDEETRILTCPWTPGETAGECRESRLAAEERFVYSIFPYRDHVLLATTRGNVFRLDGDGLEQILDGRVFARSWQPYTMMQWHDRLLIGAYPTGTLYVYDGERITPFEPPVPKQEGASERKREAQTLTLYEGAILVGVWPWGEVWRHDGEEAEGGWSLVARAFSEPEISDEETPYYKVAKRNGWGQRIVSLTPADDSLYIATSNKTSELNRSPGDEIAAQYGRIWRMRGSQVSCQIEWRERTTLRFEISDSLRIFQDGRLLCEGRAARRVPVDAELGVGDGVYGPLFRGR
ncbi:hypothetical protein [Oceanibacterium hippocampi]|uniref:Uncharacterized protein n=1 Tax=Oceanibacterium hippocampi TaxID=745714 RepID=A0A1Y5SBD1_9PROT|nr:hypothetical protein [Oceanibacterium hippocampi]SLN34146.1 hypothetical protein OCH7691_01332 [Oceanibacterium hippocampi]